MVAAYPGGTVRMSRGLFTEVFGNVPLVWESPVDDIGDLTGRKRFKFGRRQRSAAIGGKPVTLSLDDGTDWVCRISGEDNRFIEHVLSRAKPGKVVMITTRRGTIYGPQFPALTVPNS